MPERNEVPNLLDDISQPQQDPRRDAVAGGAAARSSRPGAVRHLQVQHVGHRALRPDRRVPGRRREPAADHRAATTSVARRPTRSRGQGAGRHHRLAARGQVPGPDVRQVFQRGGRGQWHVTRCSGSRCSPLRRSAAAAARPTRPRRPRPPRRSSPRCAPAPTASQARRRPRPRPTAPRRDRRRFDRRSTAGRRHAGGRRAPQPADAVADSLDGRRGGLADSVQQAREIEVMRETFAYARRHARSRSPRSSTWTTTGPEIGRSRAGRGLPGPSDADQQHRRAAGEGHRGKRHKLRVGDQLGRVAAGADPCPRCGIHDSRTSGSSARKLSRCGSRRSRRHDRIVSLDARRRRGLRDRGLPARADGPGERRGHGRQPGAGRRQGRDRHQRARRRRGPRLHAHLARPAGARRRGRQARAAPPPALYDGVKRGGVLNLRYSQFRPDVVRIVVDLDGAAGLPGRPRHRAPSGSPSAPTQAFQAWSSTTRPRPRRRRRPKCRPVAAPAAPRSARGSPSWASARRDADPRRRAADHGDLGPRQHRRRGRRLRRLQRPHHHPRQGHQGRSHRRDQEPAVAAGLPGDPRHPGPLGPGDGRRDHPGGRARRRSPPSTRSSRWRPASSGSTTPRPARSPRRSRAS